VRPVLLSWVLYAIPCAIGVWGAVTAYNLGRATVAAEVRAIRMEIDSLLVTHGDGLCRLVERTPLKSLKGLP